MIDVPTVLTTPVREPDTSRIATNGDLLEIFLDYQLSLKLCNAKLSSIGDTYGRRGDK